MKRHSRTVAHGDENGANAHQRTLAEDARDSAPPAELLSEPVRAARDRGDSPRTPACPWDLSTGVTATSHP